jgi:hypothetical protein
MLSRGKGVLLAQLFTFVSAATTTIDDTDNAWTWNNNTDGSISWYLIKPTRGCTVCGDWLPNATSPVVPVDGAYNMTFHAAHTDSTGLLKFRGMHSFQRMNSKVFLNFHPVLAKATQSQYMGFSFQVLEQLHSVSMGVH